MKVNQISHYHIGTITYHILLFKKVIVNIILNDVNIVKILNDFDQSP